MFEKSEYVETLRPWPYANNLHLTFDIHQRRHNIIWELLLKNIIVTYLALYRLLEKKYIKKMDKRALLLPS